MSRNDKTDYNSSVTQPEASQTLRDHILPGARETLRDRILRILPDVMPDMMPKNTGNMMKENAKIQTEPFPQKLEGSTTVPEPADKSVPVHVPVPVTDSILPGETLLMTYRIDSDPIPGGMGRVWRVHHTGWDVDLAMKRPKPEFFKSERDKENFTQECRNWINLGLHPNIVSCYYVREIDGVPTIFSEWMDGGSAEKCLLNGSLYDSAGGSEERIGERLLDLAIQFARGLHYAHGNGLIHQDVKPDNLLLTKEGEAKVSDFGLARARSFMNTGSSAAAELMLDADATQIAPSGGRTPAYCSPEQAAGLPLTRRTDIYSWAVSVMEFYLGGKPWARGSELTGPIAGAACREYFSMCPDSRTIPGRLQDLLAACMETDPDRRPHDFGVIEKELLDIYSDVTGDEYPRPTPIAAGDTADSLNNRALSLIDIGETEEAEKFWEEALRKDEHHVDALFNRELYLLRKGRKFDFEAIDELNRYEGVKKAGVIEAILREHPGAGEKPENPVNSGQLDLTGLYLNAASFCGEDILLSGSRIREVKSIGRIRRDLSKAGTDVRMDYLDGLEALPKKTAPAYAEYSPDGTMAAVILNDSSLLLYDPARKKTLARSGKYRDLRYAKRCCFHPAGSCLAVVFENHIYVFSIPGLTLTAEMKKTEFIGFLADGKCLLRKKVTRYKEALFRADLCDGSQKGQVPAGQTTDPAGALDPGQTAGSGDSQVPGQTKDAGGRQAYSAAGTEPEMQEVFLFEKTLQEAHEYIRGEEVFLSYSYAGKNGETFYLESDFQKKPLSGRLFEKVDSVLFYDSAQRLLCSKKDRIYFWDLRTQSCLYTTDIRGTGLQALYDDSGQRLLLWEKGSYIFFQPLALPAMPYQFRRAEWRLSHVIPARDRLAQEEQLAAFRRQFTACMKQGDTAGMVRIHESCLALPGFSGSETAWRMENSLERVAGRGPLQALRIAENDARLPEMFDDSGEQILCGEDLIAAYTENDPTRGIRFYTLEGAPVRTLSLPETADRVYVREGRVITFGKGLDLAAYDPEGGPEDPAKTAPADFNPPQYNNAGKYGSPSLLECGSRGSRILYAVTTPFSPLRKKQEMGVFQKDLRTGKEIRIQEKYHADARPLYLKNDNILVFPLPPSRDLEAPDFCLRLLHPEEGTLLREFRVSPDRMGSSDSLSVSVSPERDRFLVKARSKWHDFTLLFGIEEGLISRWEGWLDKSFFLPGGRYLCYWEGHADPILHFWDIPEKEDTYHLPLHAVRQTCVRPDGRELWIRSGVEGDGSVCSYHIEFSYELRQKT